MPSSPSRKLKIVLVLLLVFLIPVAFVAGVAFQKANPPQYAQLKRFLKEQLRSSGGALASQPCTIPEVDSIDGARFADNDLSLIIGHAYGHRKNFTNGKVSPQLTNFLANSPVSFDTLYFTGDILFEPSLAWFAEFKTEMSKYSDNLLIAPGNHDVDFINGAKRDVFKQSFDLSYPMMMTKGNSVFLIVDTNVEPWAISEDDIALALANPDKDKTLFILAHHILRPNPTDISNSATGFPRKAPDNVQRISKLEGLYKDLYVVSGDTGGDEKRPAIECKAFGSTKFVSQGLGTRDGRILVLDDDNLFAVKVN